MSKIYSVSKLNAYIKSVFDMDYALSNISIEGEISNCKYHSTGHIYFTLKDDKSQISALMFAGKRRLGLNIDLKDGMKVVVSGSIEVYEKGGTYNINADKIKEAGIGLLYEKYLQLKNFLEKEGLFDIEHKKALPKYARKIGIVSSKTGAAIEDMIKVSKRRNPYVELILYPSLVQGENAAKNIVRGIEYLDKLDLDIIIVGRGGGSIEDLWAFNEEIVARAIYEAKTFIISAVGHQTDYTIADFVADYRAATPSQAAELANFDYDIFENHISNLKSRLFNALESKVISLKNEIQRYELHLNRYKPDKRINQYLTYLIDLSNKLETSFKNILNDKKIKFASLSQRLELLSPLKQINSGYAYISNLSNKRISSAKMLKKDEIINIKFSDGEIKSKILEIDYK